MHHAIIVVNPMLVILERVELVIYEVTCNQNVENILIERLIRNKRPLVLILRKRSGMVMVLRLGI